MIAWFRDAWADRTRMTPRDMVELFAAWALAVLLAFAFTMFWGVILHARDLGQWENLDPALRQWYGSLKQPDNPTISCCGEADAYWADSFEVTADGNYIAIITDERDNKPLIRVPIAPGTKVVVPKHKIKFDQGNPTGHGIVFISPWSAANTPEDLYVLCYLPPGGV